VSRTAHFGIGVGIILLCVLWCVFGVFVFWAVAVGKDSRGATIYDSSFITLYVIFGAGLLVGFGLAFLSFRRALRPPQLDSPPEPPLELSTPERRDDVATPDERLAHLVKKTKR
jgi:cytochrome b561